MDKPYLQRSPAINQMRKIVTMRNKKTSKLSRSWKLEKWFLDQKEKKERIERISDQSFALNYINLYLCILKYTSYMGH